MLLLLEVMIGIVAVFLVAQRQQVKRLPMTAEVAGPQL